MNTKHKSKTTIIALFVSGIALCLSATLAWADDAVITITSPMGPDTTVTVTRTAKVAPHKVTINFPVGSVAPFNVPWVRTGTYFDWTADGTKFGQSYNSGGGCGDGDPQCDDDKWPHGPVQQVQPLIITDNLEGTGVDLSWDLVAPWGTDAAWGVPGKFYVDQDGWHGWKQGLFYIDENGNEHFYAPDGAKAGITLQFTNNKTGSFNVYLIPIPFCSGFFNFVGNDIDGYWPSQFTDVKIGSYSLMGGKAPPTNPQLQKHQP